MNRSRDWWVQAEADLRHARHALEDGDFEWACFAAHQAAEKALKALFEAREEKVWGHSVARMLEILREQGVSGADQLLEAAKILDKHYIPTRYPNGLEQGAPTEFYTAREARDAIGYSEQILRFCNGLLRR